MSREEVHPGPEHGNGIINYTAQSNVCNYVVACAISEGIRFPVVDPGDCREKVVASILDDDDEISAVGFF